MRERQRERRERLALAGEQLQVARRGLELRRARTEVEATMPEEPGAQDVAAQRPRERVVGEAPVRLVLARRRGEVLAERALERRRPGCASSSTSSTSTDTGVSGGSRTARAASAAAPSSGTSGPPSAQRRIAPARPGRSSAPASAASRPSGASRSSAWASSTSSAVSPTARTRSTSAAGAIQPPAWVGSASSGAACAARGARAGRRDPLDRRAASRAWRRAGEPRRRDVQDAARVALRVEPAQRRRERLELRRRTARRSGAGPRP